MNKPTKEPSVTTKVSYQQALSNLLGKEIVGGGEVAIHRRVRAGLPVDAVRRLIDAGVGREVVDNIVKPRTLDHRKQKGEALSPDESDKLFRVAHLIALGDKVFGNHDKTMRWLSKPKRFLDGETPLEMALTTQGSAMVEETLHGIDHGFFA